MTPEERDRLRTLEVQLQSMNTWLASVDGKLEELRIAAHMGKGAWLLILKLGTVFVALAAGIAWIADKFVGKHP